MPSLWGCVDSFRVQPEKAWITIDFVGCGYKHLCERLIRDIKNESGKEGKSRMRKAIRLLCYGKELAFMAFFKAVGAVLRACSSKYRNIWLVGERGNDARDNGYWFYHYLRTEHPEISSYYVISEDSVDRRKITALGGAVAQRSLKHYLLYYCADVLAGTHIQPCAPDLMVHYHLASKGIRARGKQIFLRHGIIKDEMEWQHRDRFYTDLFCCGAKPEYEFIRDTFGFAKEVPQYLGLCRFDNLIRAGKRDKVILVMPTWRGSYYPSGDAFLKTAFFEKFQSFLSGSRVKEMLETYDYQLIFYPHVEMQKYNKHFHTDSDRITIADKSTHDVQQLLMSCSLLITDYSSVFFDVAFLEKPVLFYQFDEEEFRKYHYQKGYFDYRRDGFGPVCTEETEVLEETRACLERGMELQDDYRERVRAFFPMRDAKNCQRTFEAIKKLI